MSFSQKHHRDRRNIESRLRKILPAFGDRYADQIKPFETDDWLAKNTNTAATANRYRYFSLRCNMSCSVLIPQAVLSATEADVLEEQPGCALAVETTLARNRVLVRQIEKLTNWRI